MLHKITLCCLLWGSTLTALAQNGTISGKVVDQETGEELIGVNVVVEGTSKGASTDLSGTYNFSVEPGTYTLTVSYISYASQRIEGVEVTPGEMTEINISLFTESVELKEVVVQAAEIRNDEVALLSMQRKSLSVQDGISSQEIGRTGSGNAAESMQYITGASVEDGKFMVVRGLGDRYSITQLDGVTLPSTDPYRNSSSLDLIPSIMIDNIVAMKTFTPDQPGNFTGGNVDINTKSLPEQFFVRFSTALSVNTQASFQDEFLTYEGGGLDWLGYDDGTRELPDFFRNNPRSNGEDLLSDVLFSRTPEEFAETAESRARLQQFSNQITNRFIPDTIISPMNYGAAFSIGNRQELFGNPIGYTFNVSYARSYSYFNDGTLGIWSLTDLANADSLQQELLLNTAQGTENNRLGGLATLAYQIGRSEFTAKVLYNNDADITGFSGEGTAEGGFLSNPRDIFQSRTMAFVQRQLGSGTISGKHSLPLSFLPSEVEIEWQGSYTISSQYEPDIQFFANQITEVVQRDEDGRVIRDAEGNPLFRDSYVLAPTQYDAPFHFFRNLEDTQLNSTVDVTVPLNEKGTNRIKFGGYFNQKDRDFEEYRFQVIPNPPQLRASQLPEGYTSPFVTFTGSAGPTGNLRPFFDQSNFGIIDTIFNTDGSVQRYITGTTVEGTSLPSNFYQGTERFVAGYAMGVVQITEQLRVIGGARLETTYIEVNSGNEVVGVGPSSVIDRTSVHIPVPAWLPFLRDEAEAEDSVRADLLPSISLIYAVNDRSNIRLSASQTLARPNLREVSPFISFDLIGGFFYAGNPQLTRTLVQNYDARYEFYPTPSELFAVSGYLKRFDGPIIPVLDPDAQPNATIQFQNVSEALVYGGEFELRKNLGFISPFLQNFRFGTNFSYIFSEADKNEEELRDARDRDPDISETRAFVGQSSFLFNANLNYANIPFGFETTLSFNFSSQRLYSASLLAVPDIEEIPIQFLNLTASKRFGDHIVAGLTIKNILNGKFRRFQEFRGNEFPVQEYRIGRTFGVSVTYQID